MAFAEVDVIVDGTLDQSMTFRSLSAIDKFVEGVADAARADGLRTEVYVLWHEHDESIECECAQYLTDHHPMYSYNTEAR